MRLHLSHLLEHELNSSDLQPQQHQQQNTHPVEEH